MSTKLYELFEKPIDRDIQGVIKVGQEEQENKKQELEEYVVTKELERHFRTFYRNYLKSITGNTDKVGVWISGFFGSGKSHFLKILSYLLDNELVDGKTAYQYFEEGKKFSDPMFLADMKLVADTPMDVILFNIDAKGKRTESLPVTFLKVFNEHLGYYADNPRISSLERDMDRQNKYELFKEEFLKAHGSSWNSARHRSDFIEDDIVIALDAAGIMSKEAARTWYSTIHEEFDVSVRQFADIVKAYIDTKPKGHHVVFMVDEVGQYIGDDSQLMLNLQTITEEFGSLCGGQAWMVVTSQQNIDDIVKVKGDDFSKIQGRFDTRLSLSSAHADEVIRRRILEKKDHSKKMLEGVYEENRTSIGNLILFDDGPERKLYESPSQFAEDYPFVPYQFDLVASTLQSIRTHGASGKHLSEGERSMLSLFQESAAELKDKEVGVLVPYNQYYDSLVQFIDHSHAAVIERASRNSHLEDKDGGSFAVEVLKTLFLIKYITGMKSTANNITSLMVSNINEDRIELQEKVETALRNLVQEALVQKNAEVYVFLTNEEQEINRAIDNMQIERGETYRVLGEIIFSDIIGDNKCVHPSLGNQYVFTYKTSIDDHTINVRGDAISLRVITPLHEFFGDETRLRQLSQDNKEVVVALSRETSFMQETENYLKIEKFLRSEAARNMKDFTTIQAKKTEELKDSRKRSVEMLKDSLRYADVYINGNPHKLNHTEISSRMEEAMGILLSEIYVMLGTIETVKGSSDIKETLTTSRHSGDIKLAGMREDNHLALSEMQRYLQRTASETRVSLKSVKADFENPPYGFKANDVLWLLAVLFREEEISFYFNGELQDSRSNGEDIYRFISSSRNDDSVLIAKRQKASKQSKDDVRDLLRDVFNKTTVVESDGELFDTFQDSVSYLLSQLKDYERDYKNNAKFEGFPGRDVLEEGTTLLGNIQRMTNVFDFFGQISDYHDELLDFRDDFEELEEFLENDDQKELFAQGIHYYGIFETNQTFISEQELLDTADAVKRILDMPRPYHQIHLLNQYNPKLEDLLMQQLERSSRGPLSILEEEYNRVRNNVEDLEFPEKDSFKARVRTAFDGLKEKITGSNSILEINGVPTEAEVKRQQFYAELEEIRENLKREAERAHEEATETGELAAVQMPLPKARKSISMRQISPARHWELESRDDIDKHLNTVRAKLIEELEENTILEVEL